MRDLLEIRSSAVEYLAYGWKPLLLHHMKKQPNARSWDWKSHNPTEAEILSWPTDGNLGVLMGSPSNLLDIDLDDPIAVGLATRFLPTTLRFGRKSNPSSHWLYTCHACRETRKFADHNGGMLVELRSSGCQTMMPPSIHPEGEMVEWESGTSIAEITYDDLHRCVSHLSAATLLTKFQCRMDGLPSSIDAVVGHYTQIASSQIADRVSQWLGLRREVPVLDRARAYVQAMPPAVAGSGGDLMTWKVSIALKRGFSLSDSDVMTILREYSARCSPPWSEKDLAHKVSQANKSTQSEGFLLTESPPHWSTWRLEGHTEERPSSERSVSKRLWAMVDGWVMGRDRFGCASYKIDGELRSEQTARSVIIDKYSAENAEFVQTSALNNLFDTLRDKALRGPVIEDDGETKVGLGGERWGSLEGVDIAATALGGQKEYFVQDWIEPRTVTYIVGDPGAGKSWVAFDLLTRVMVGDTWHGKQCIPANLGLIITNEMADDQVQDRMCKLVIGLEKQPVALRWACYPRHNFASPDFVEHMREIYEANDRKPAFVVFDTLTSMSPGVDENSNEIARPLNVLRELAGKFMWSFVVLGHTRKNADVGDSPLAICKGNSAIPGACDQVLLVSKIGERRFIRSIKAQRGVPMPRHEWSISDHYTPGGRTGGVVLTSMGEVAEVEEEDEEKPKNRRRK